MAITSTITVTGVENSGSFAVKRGSVALSGSYVEDGLTLYAKDFGLSQIDQFEFLGATFAEILLAIR